MASQRRSRSREACRRARRKSGADGSFDKRNEARPFSMRHHCCRSAASSRRRSAPEDPGTSQQPLPDADQIFKRHITEAWPGIAEAPAVDLTPDQVLDCCAADRGRQGRTANKAPVPSACGLPVRARRADHCLDPGGLQVPRWSSTRPQTRRSPQFDRAEATILQGRVAKPD